MKKKSDKAFIAKIKTLTIGTGTKGGDKNCGNCGKPIDEHMQLVGVALIPISALPKPPEAAKPEQPKHEEKSFAA